MNAYAGAVSSFPTAYLSEISLTALWILEHIKKELVATKRTVVAAAVLGMATLVVEVGMTSLAVSHVALTKWWTPGDLAAVMLTGTMLISAGASLAMGYITARVWPAIVPQVMLAIATAIPLQRIETLMQGFIFPTAVLTALLFGWIGARLKVLSSR